MDIILFYISLHLKTKSTERMSTSDFYVMSEEIWNKWSREKENNMFSHLCGAYCSGPGPMGGTASSAEMYLSHYTHITCFENIQKFFTDRCGWKYYRDVKVVPRTLPKWRRAKHLKKINRVFSLAEIFCKEIEDYKAER